MTTFGSGRTQVDGQGTPPFIGNALHCLPIGSMGGKPPIDPPPVSDSTPQRRTVTWNLPIGLWEGTYKDQGV